MPYQTSLEDLRTKAAGEEEVKLVSWNIYLLDKEEDDVANSKEQRKQRGCWKRANEFI